jgi:hypothetical protein
LSLLPEFESRKYITAELPALGGAFTSWTGREISQIKIENFSINSFWADWKTHDNNSKRLQRLSRKRLRLLRGDVHISNMAEEIDMTEPLANNEQDNEFVPVKRKREASKTPTSIKRGPTIGSTIPDKNSIYQLVNQCAGVIE